MPLIHTCITSEDEDLGKFAEAVWNFAHGTGEGVEFEFSTSDGFTAHGYYENGVKFLIIEDTNGAVA
jgi:hypothetical protein